MITKGDDLRLRLRSNLSSQRFVVTKRAACPCFDNSATLWQQSFTQADRASSASFGATLEAIEHFVEQYHTEARGSEKTPVPLAFYLEDAASVFRRLDALVM